MGRELDSLADVISFGVAPAAIAYGCGMQGFYDRVVLVFFVACGVSRLARYNVTAEKLSEGGDKVKYFEGTPIPTSLVLVAVLAAAAYSGRARRPALVGRHRDRRFPVPSTGTDVCGVRLVDGQPASDSEDVATRGGCRRQRVVAPLLTRFLFPGLWQQNGQQNSSALGGTQFVTSARIERSLGRCENFEHRVELLRRCRNIARICEYSRASAGSLAVGGTSRNVPGLARS